MRLRPVATIAVALALATPAPASEPGQPLDCSDWVFLEPGLTCTVFAQEDCAADPDSWYCSRPDEGAGITMTNDHRMIYTRTGAVDWGDPNCSGTGGRLEVVAFDGTDTHVLAYADDRCAGQSCGTR